jgi:hypothetical protein
MKAIRKFWDSLHGLAAALDRLTGLAHQAADAVEERLPAPALDAAPGRTIEPRKGKSQEVKKRGTGRNGHNSRPPLASLLGDGR